MLISICTTTARRGFVEQQAKMLAGQKLDGHGLEWVLVDFAHEERQQSLRELAERLALRLTHVPNVRDDQRFFRDITRNRNKALMLAQGDAVIFLDDYAVIPDTFVTSHLSIMKQGCLSAGQMHRLDQQLDDPTVLDGLEPPTILERYQGKIGQDYRAIRDGHQVVQPYRAIGISYTGNLGIPRMVFEHINGFDPRMESGLEDCDFGLRAHMAGFGCYFNPRAYTINLQNGHVPYVFSFDHAHDVEPFISNPNNNFRGDAKLPENEHIRVEFHPNYRIAHCKHCGAHGMIDPNELMAYKGGVREFRTPPGLPGSLDILRKLEVRCG